MMRLTTWILLFHCVICGILFSHSHYRFNYFILRLGRISRNRIKWHINYGIMNFSGRIMILCHHAFMVFLDTPLKVKLFYFIPSRLHLIWLFISFTIQVGRSLLYYEHFILKWKISSSKDLKVCELIGGGNTHQEY
jgi:hypothetical protein